MNRNKIKYREHKRQQQLGSCNDTTVSCGNAPLQNAGLDLELAQTRIRHGCQRLVLGVFFFPSKPSGFWQCSIKCVVLLECVINMTACGAETPKNNNDKKKSRRRRRQRRRSGGWRRRRSRGLDNLPLDTEQIPRDAAKDLEHLKD